jgi:hypothetical protein
VLLRGGTVRKDKPCTALIGRKRLCDHILGTCRILGVEGIQAVGKGVIVARVDEADILARAGCEEGCEIGVFLACNAEDDVPPHGTS